mgnify:CR=1 FL=1
MEPEEKVVPIESADDEIGRQHIEPVMTTRMQRQQAKSDARLKAIIAQAVEKVNRPATVDEQTNTYPPKIAPFIKKRRPKGREGSR